LLQFPSKRMFAAAAAHDKNFHGNEASSGKQLSASAGVAPRLIGGEMTVAS